jgi:hypothetical protein
LWLFRTASVITGRHTGKFLIFHTLVLDCVRIFSGEGKSVRVGRILS